MAPDRHHRLAAAIIRFAAILVPAGQREEWVREWTAELASLKDRPVAHRRSIRRALGAFADGFWMRQRHVADLDWIDDVRFGVRQMRRHGSFAGAAVGILSIGLAATITMFSVTDQVLLRPLPYPDADRIVTVWETRAPHDEPLEVAPGNLLDWRARAQAFAHLAGAAPWAVDVLGGSRPEVWFGAKVTEGFFEAFGITPVAGRLFRADEYQKGRDKVAIITEGFWRRRFGADRTVLGTVVTTDAGPLTIVGILPASFEPRLLPTGNGFREVFQPKAIEEYEPRVRSSGWWMAVGRLKPGVSLEAAQAEMSAISQQIAREHPRTNEHTGARVLTLREHLVGNVDLAVQLLGGAVLLVLLVACVNVANLMLARGSAREREIAVRVALGARRARVVRQLLLESAVIAVASAVVGCALASAALRVLRRLGPATVPWIDTLTLDWRAVGVAVVIAGFVALVAGLLPAWRSAHSGLTASARTTTADAAQHRLRAGLVVAEIALALVILSGGALLLRSFVGLMRVDPGFARERVLVTQVFAWDYNPTPAALQSFFDTTLQRIRALPAVQHAGVVSAMPFIESNINIESVFSIVGRPAVNDGEAPRTHLTVASEGYFHAMRIPLKAGRLLDDRDGAETPRVALISESLASRHWPVNETPLGSRLQYEADGETYEVEIVGVVGALRHETLDSGPRDEVFLPLPQVPFGSLTFVVRTAGDASALLEPVRQAIWSVNPDQTIYRAATLDQLVDNTVSPRRFALAVIVGFAVLTLLLAVAGVYSVLSAIMNARLREVGVRVALGASRWDIVRLVLARGAAMVGVGLAVGLAGALGAGRLLQSFLFGITPTDPLAISVAAALMVAAALVACLMPARRAAGADPVAVLRAE